MGWLAAMGWRIGRTAMMKKIATGKSLEELEV